jgi:murein DD-endopeptidase
MRARSLLPLLAFAAVLAGCAGVPRAPRGPEPGADPGPAVAGIAEGLVGTPYRFGGEDGHGFDCSGLAVYAYDRVGIAIPRTAAEQERSARGVSVRDLRPGDLLFFRIHSRHIDHVAIYVGRGRFVHAPHSGALVSFGSLRRRFFRRRLVKAGRFR